MMQVTPANVMQVTPCYSIPYSFVCVIVEGGHFAFLGPWTCPYNVGGCVWAHVRAFEKARTGKIAKNVRKMPVKYGDLHGHVPPGSCIFLL